MFLNQLQNITGVDLSGIVQAFSSLGGNSVLAYLSDLAGRTTAAVGQMSEYIPVFGGEDFDLFIVEHTVINYVSSSVSSISNALLNPYSYSPSVLVFTVAVSYFVAGAVVSCVIIKRLS